MNIFSITSWISYPYIRKCTNFGSKQNSHPSIYNGKIQFPQLFPAWRELIVLFFKMSENQKNFVQHQKHLSLELKYHLPEPLSFACTHRSPIFSFSFMGKLSNIDKFLSRNESKFPSIHKTHHRIEENRNIE